MSDPKDTRREEFDADCGGDSCKEKECVYLEYSGGYAANYDVGVHNAGDSRLVAGNFYKVPQDLAERLLDSEDWEKATKKDALAAQKEAEEGEDETSDDEEKSPDDDGGIEDE